MNARARSVVRLGISLRSYSSCQSSFPNFTAKDKGKLYETRKEVCQQLLFSKQLPSPLRKQLDTLGECVWMVREPLVQVCEWMQSSSTAHPAVRLLLWGRFGTGKSVTLNQACDVALEKGFIIFYVHSAMELTRQVREVEMSTYKAGRINDPMNASAILNNFKQYNSHAWSRLTELKTSKAYEWTKKDRTEEGQPLTHIVEMGLSAPFLASDCVGGLLRELRMHAQRGDMKLLLAVDDANSLWGKTLVKRADFTFANAAHLTLVHHLRKILTTPWSNGCILLVGDQKEVSDARDTLTVPRTTPLQVFGLDGLQAVEPFVSMETSLYSEEEIAAIHEYFVRNNWLSSTAARSPAGLMQLKHLSAYNPFNFDRLCAFV